MTTSYLLISLIEIFARAGGGRRHVVVGTRSVRPAAPARETFAAATAFEPAGSAVRLRLRPGDEGGQTIDAAGIGNHRLRLGLRLILRLRAMLALAMMFARLLIALVAIGLALARLEVALLIVFARHERLLLLRHEAGLLAEMRK